MFWYRSGQLRSKTLDFSKHRLFSNFFAATKELVSVMKGHTSAVHSLSVHGSGRYTLTSSFDTTILWDLNTFTKKRTLNGAQDVGIQKVHHILSKTIKIISPILVASLIPRNSCLGHCANFAVITYACTYYVSNFGYEIHQNRYQVIHIMYFNIPRKHFMVRIIFSEVIRQNLVSTSSS